MKKLPIGIQSFEVLRRQGYLYMDKTEHIYRMVEEGMFYFPARSRRFGKSLLVSTLRALFRGRRDLFHGLMMVAEANRRLLRELFGVLKGGNISSALRFVFLTGVSQFSKVSIFSELNNPRDISMSRRYADAPGYTQAELETTFAHHIARFAAETGRSPAAILEGPARHYDGYRFSDRDVRVYNSFSVLNAFADLDFHNYRFETRTPTSPVELLRREEYDLSELEGVRVDRAAFTTFEIDNLSPEALLFQTGYLTIKDVEGDLYTLGYPNREVKTAFTQSLLLEINFDTEEHNIVGWKVEQGVKVDAQC